MIICWGAQLQHCPFWTCKVVHFCVATFSKRGLQKTNRKTVNYDNIVVGIRFFMIGLFKKVIIADTFSSVVSWGTNNLIDCTWMDLMIVIISYTMQIYFDFSGYCDMATSLSNVLNIDLPINFNSPYKATSIRDFWKRWHISLTSWFRDYLYIPLGGNRKGKIRTYINV